MAQENPLLLVGMVAAVGVTFKWWWEDYLAARAGRPSPRAFPGTTTTRNTTVLIAVAGAGALLAVETAGEYHLGLTAQQSRMTGLFALYSLAAAFAEELVFRGYLVIESRGTGVRLAGILGASVLFALLHPFLWTWDEGRLELHHDAKAWFSTGMVFAGSLWFYAVRFFPLNPERSLLPCFAAHATKNLGVFAIKYAQGFVSGWW